MEQKEMLEFGRMVFKMFYIDEDPVFFYPQKIRRREIKRRTGKSEDYCRKALDKYIEFVKKNPEEYGKLDPNTKSIIDGFTPVLFIPEYVLNSLDKIKKFAKENKIELSGQFISGLQSHLVEVYNNRGEYPTDRFRDFIIKTIETNWSVVKNTSDDKKRREKFRWLAIPEIKKEKKKILNE